MDDRYSTKDLKKTVNEDFNDIFKRTDSLSSNLDSLFGNQAKLKCGMEEITRSIKEARYKTRNLTSRFNEVNEDSTHNDGAKHDKRETKETKHDNRESIETKHDNRETKETKHDNRESKETKHDNRESKGTKHDNRESKETKHDNRESKVKDGHTDKEKEAVESGLMKLISQIQTLLSRESLEKIFNTIVVDKHIGRPFASHQIDEPFQVDECTCRLCKV